NPNRALRRTLRNRNVRASHPRMGHRYYASGSWEKREDRARFTAAPGSARFHRVCQSAIPFILGVAVMAHPGTLAKTADPLDQLDNTCKYSGCNPGKCRDTRRMVFASRTGRPDIADDRYLCISV